MTHAIFQRSTHTIGDLCDAVMAIHDEAAASAFYEGYVAWTRGHATDERYRTPEGAEDLARSNIGWFFGEGMPPEDIRMWVQACGASHPVFGSMIPTPEQAVRAGLTLGEGR